MRSRPTRQTPFPRGHGSGFQPTSRVFQSTEKETLKHNESGSHQPPISDTTSWHTTSPPKQPATPTGVHRRGPGPCAPAWSAPVLSRVDTTASDRSVSRREGTHVPPGATSDTMKARPAQDGAATTCVPPTMVRLKRTPACQLWGWCPPVLGMVARLSLGQSPTGFARPQLKQHPSKRNQHAEEAI